MTPFEIGASIRKRRGELGISQRSLADSLCAAGHPWTQSTVSKVERGVRELSLSEAVTAADLLGLSLDLEAVTVEPSESEATTDTDAAVGLQLRAVRLIRGQSQSVLADALRARGHRTSQATIWAIESGDRPLRVSELIDLGAILGFGPCDFLRLCKEPSAPCFRCAGMPPRGFTCNECGGAA